MINQPLNIRSAIALATVTAATAGALTFTAATADASGNEYPTCKAKREVIVDYNKPTHCDLVPGQILTLRFPAFFPRAMRKPICNQVGGYLAGNYCRNIDH